MPRIVLRSWKNPIEVPHDHHENNDSHTTGTNYNHVTRQITTNRRTKQEDKYYAIYSKELKETIYVTGSHFILDENKNKFIPVEKYAKAQKSVKTPEVMYCLITNTHNIPVGEYTFYDWEDDDISRNYYLSELVH